jgi:hypothetical protein
MQIFRGVLQAKECFPLRRECPFWFQERLAQVGGRNPYGEPRFKLVWGESETMRDGGYFVKDDYEGYRDVPAIGGEACWAIVMWEPAEKFGTAYQWYRDNRDELTGLVTLGQYPYRGRYRVIRKLIHREMVNGEWLTTRMEPTHFILEIMIPLIVMWNRFTNEQRMKVVEEDLEKEEREADRIRDDAMRSFRIRRDSPLVQKRLEKMEKTMAQAMAIARQTQTGLTQKGA